MLRPRSERGLIATITDFADLIAQLDHKPAVIGHSFGGLITQIIAGRGLAAASVAVDPAPFRGVLPLPISSLKSASPLADRALHLELDQTVHLDGVLHRELLDDRLDEAVDDQLRGVFLGDSV